MSCGVAADVFWIVVRYCGFGITRSTLFFSRSCSNVPVIGVPL